MKLRDSLHYFLRKCNVNQLSINTIINYEHHLNPYVKFIENLLGDDVEVEDITEEHNLLYLEQIPKDYSKSTIRSRYTYLKIFFKTLFECEIIHKNPVKTIKVPRKQRTIIYAFNRNEIQEILSMFDKSDFIGFRNYVIFSLFFGTGIRRGELIGLMLQDINIELDYIRVMGKGSKERYVPIGETLKKVLTIYLRRRKAFLEQKGYNAIQYVFIARDGKKLTDRGVNCLFHNIRDSKRQWSTRVSPHTLRHTFAKFFLLNGGDVFTLQKILGHNDISTTRVYVDLNDQEVKMQNHKYNPLDNPRWQYY